MKTARKAKKSSPKNISEEFKSVDKSSVPVTNVDLSGRTRNKQRRKEAKTNKIPLDKLGEGISRLSKPKPVQQPLEINNWRVKKSALKYTGSKRLEVLSTPRMKTQKKIDVIPSRFSFQSTINPSALKYTASPRILRLSKPRQYEVPEETLNAYDDEAESLF